MTSPLRRGRVGLVALAGLAAGLCLAPASAQKAARPEAGRGAAAPEKTAPVEKPAPAPLYEAPMLRLAEILGGLAFLRDLCEPGAGASFREEARKLIETEKSPLREKLVGAFNRGFTGYADNYGFCSANAVAAAEGLRREGERFARDIGARFGG